MNTHTGRVATLRHGHTERALGHWGIVKGNLHIVHT